MAKLIWTEPAFDDLQAIAEYISLENHQAATHLISKIFQHLEQLKVHPESGSIPRELKEFSYRQIIEPPCRIIYRYHAGKIFIVHVLRGERLLRNKNLKRP